MLAILTSRSAPGLTLEQVVERLRSAFEVQVDADAGRAHAERELALLRRLSAPGDIIEMFEAGARLARWITLRDGGASVEFLLMPEASIRIDHHDETESLVQRCATLLDCDVESCG